MKTIIFGCVLFIGMMTTAVPARAQVSVSINISSQPLWGPVGYDYVEYYYLPDLGVYYYVPTHQFIYLSGGRWVFAGVLPYPYRSYNLYNIHKVVINEPRPYLHYHVHRARYAHFRGGPHNQVFIRNSRDPRYFVVKGHPRYHARGMVKAKGTPAGRQYKPAPAGNGKPMKMRSSGKAAGMQPGRTKQASPHMQKSQGMRAPLQKAAPRKGGGGQGGGGHKGGGKHGR